MEQSRHVVALCALIFSAAAAAHEEPRPRLLAVAGQGEVKVAPDRADVSFAVEASEKSLADAEKLVGDGVARLLRLCESLEIPKAQIRSAQLNVQPQYESGGVISSRPRIVGYYVSRQVDVDLKELGKLGKLLQGAIENGANRVAGVGFDSTRRDEHQRSALALAAQDARANAETLGRAIGVKLGRLHTVNASEEGGMPFNRMRYDTMQMKVGEGSAEQGYQPGELTFRATVNVEFDLP